MRPPVRVTTTPPTNSARRGKPIVTPKPVKSAPLASEDADWNVAIQKTLAKGDAIIKGDHKVVDKSPPDMLSLDKSMSQADIEHVTGLRNDYFAQNVDITLSPAVSQLGRAAYYEACKSFKQEAPDWQDCTPHVQVKWCLVALAAIGAHHAMPYKPLSTAPRKVEEPIYIWYEKQWRHALFSAGKKPMWYMRDGFQIAADDKACNHIIYTAMQAPTFFAGFEDIIDHVDNYSQNPVEPIEQPKSRVSKTDERPSKITREIRSPASPLISRGNDSGVINPRDGKPETDEYYPKNSNMIAAEKLNWQKVPHDKPAPAKAKPVVKSPLSGFKTSVKLR